MKCFKSLSFIIACCSMLLISWLSACNPSTTDDGLDDINSSIENIKEADLPKGKPVIEDDVSVPASYSSTEAMALGKSNVNTQPNTNKLEKTVSHADYFKKKFRELLVFHADDTMEVNKPKLATLILGKNESIADLKVQVLDESEAEDERIKFDTAVDLGSKMKARLISFGGTRMDKNFEIEPLGDEIQSFSKDRKKILWQWKITPLKPGQQELKLSIQIIEKDGESVSLPARNIPVVIFAKSENFLTKAGNFIENKYEWLITAIMLPILIAWFTTKIRNRHPKPHPENTSKKA